MKLPPFLPRDLVADLRSHERVSGNSWLVSLLTHEPLWVQTTFRIAQAIEKSRLPRFAKRILRIPIKVLHQALGLLTGISIPTVTKVGPGLHISHFGGIVISPHAEIGPKCFLHQGVTIGVKHTGERPGAPRIGRGVFIGAGAKIIGGVTIGDYASIGANAVVTKDIPTKAVAIGIPARVVKEREVEEWFLQD